MLHKLTSTYQEIAKYFPELEDRPSPSARNKQLLLEMAKNGHPRPTARHPLGPYLVRYTSKSKSHDPEFTKDIRKTAPQWFVTQSEVADQKKTRLLSLARAGKPRPPQKETLGAALSRYINTESASHDPEFTKDIRKTAPQWFDIPDQKKRRLLEMAKKGKPKPNQGSPLRSALSNYMSKSHGSYDPEFTKDIRKTAPQWFVSHAETTEKNKRELLGMARKKGPRPNQQRTYLGAVLSRLLQKKSPSYDPDFVRDIDKLAPHWIKAPPSQNKRQLLDMARNGSPRPKHKTKMGSCLCRYTTPSRMSYDPEFTRQIKKARPEWLVLKSQVANQKKKILLKMAEGAKAKPSPKSSLLAALRSYTTPSQNAYDPTFDREIRKLRPDWFVTPAEIANKKKELLRNMARAGEQRPNHNTHLGRSLCRYVYKGMKSHDPIFTKQIKKLAPHWFKQCSTN